MYSIIVILLLNMDSIANICRLCLRQQQDSNLHNLFGQNLISMKIMSLFQLTVSFTFGFKSIITRFLGPCIAHAGCKLASECLWLLR